MTQEFLTAAQIEELNKPLAAEAVRTRSQSGRNLSYIEGWWAIREANRIFGFGCWSQELVDVKCVSERERTIGQAKKPGWGVSYVATVRIIVSGVRREGVGAGHGIDVDLGQAHESAIKEAATDAMKRALMTFGNQFGLALYDKEQRQVEDVPVSDRQVSEADRQAKKFVEHLLQKMEQVGIDADGIKTLKIILNVSDFSDVSESIRQKLIERLTPDYAKMLNAGKNSSGVQVLRITSAEIEASTEKLQKAASAAFG